MSSRRMTHQWQALHARHIITNRLQGLRRFVMDSEETLEGLDENRSLDWVEYPIDSVLIRTETRTVYDILRRIRKGAFIMNPEFQRDSIWKDDQQSKLIESVMMRLPLPVFYLAEDEHGRKIVVDGLQRLSVLRRFIANDLQLDLPQCAKFHNKRFDDLNPKFQNRIEDCNLILHVIDYKVPERVRLNILDRVNSGVPLTRQQMRNSLYSGKATRFLREEAHANLFRQATGHSLREDTMRDREFVNRFCAFELLDVNTYRDMDDHLSKALTNMNSMSDADLESLSQKFRRGLRNNFELFGRYAFRKHQYFHAVLEERRNPLNASLWDVMSTTLSRYQRSTIATHATKIKEQFYTLIKHSDFNRYITIAPNSPKNVRGRFKAANIAFKGFFDAN